MGKDSIFIDDPYFIEYNGRKMAKSSHVKNKIGMRLYLEFYKDVFGMEMTPTAILERIQEDRKRDPLKSGIVEKEWNHFVRWLIDDYRKYDRQLKKTKKKLSPLSVKLYAGAIKSFYSYFRFPLSPRAKFPTEVSQSEGVVANQRICYRPVNVKKLLSAVSKNRDKAIILWMFQSGMDISTTMTMKYGDIRDDLERSVVPLPIHATRHKTKKNFKTFIGPDAINALKVHLDERRQPRYVCEKCGVSWKVQRSICTKKNCRSKVVKRKMILRSEDYLFDRRHENFANVAGEVESAMREYVIVGGVISKDKLKRADMNPAGTHALRVGFSTILQLLGVNQDIVDGLMGHTVPYNGAYSRMSVRELSKIYEKVMPELSVMGSTDPGELHERMELLEKEVGELKRKMAEREEVVNLFSSILGVGKEPE